MVQSFLSLMMMLLCVACSGPRYVDYFPYHDDGVPKPRVAILPMSDHPESGLDWSFSEEVENGLYYELMNSGMLYVLSPQEIGPPWDKRDNYDIFGNNPDYVKDFCGADIVVALELIEHSIVPFDPCAGREATSPTLLSSTQGILMRVRLKIVDIRCGTPRILLYEVVKNCYPLTPGTCIEHVCAKEYGSDNYAKTQCGMIHRRMICELSSRIEEVARCIR